MTWLTRLVISTSLAVLMVSTARVFTQSPVTMPTECTVAALQALAPKGTTITAATMVAAAGRVP